MKQFVGSVIAILFSYLGYGQCTGGLGDPIVNITFGAGTANPGPPLAAGITNMQYYGAQCPNDGLYTISNYTTNCFGGHWHTTHDHTGDPNGYFMVINATITPSDFFVDTISNFCTGTTYFFGSWIQNLCISDPILPNVTFTIETTTGTLLQTYTTGNIPNAPSAVWIQYGFYFTMPPGVSTIILRMHNNAPGGSGNDLALDDITFRPAGPKVTAGFVGSPDSTEITLCTSNAVPIDLTATVDSCYSVTSLQWEESLDNGVTWFDISGAVTTSYTRQPTTQGVYKYRLVAAAAGNIQFSSCRVVSEILTVNVVQGPTIALGAVQNPSCTAPDGSIQVKGSSPNTFYTIYYTRNGVALSVSATADANGNILISGLSSGVYDSIEAIGICTSNIVGPVTLVKPVTPPAVVSNYTYCQYQTAPALTATGTSLLWYTAATGGTGNSTAPTPSTNTPGTTLYYVTQTINSCESDRAPITIVVNAKPAPPATQDTIYCEGKPAATLTATGQQLLWYNTASGGVGSPVTPIQSTNMPDTAIWYVSQTVNGCESDRSKLEVMVDFTPKASVSAVTRVIVCQEDTMTFYFAGNHTDIGSYLWVIPQGHVVKGQGTQDIVASFDLQGANTAMLIVTTGRCSDTATYVVGIYPRPTVKIITAPDVCINKASLVTISEVDSNRIYHVDLGGADLINGIDSMYGIYTVDWTTVGMHVITVGIESKECPEDFFTDTVNVHGLPIAGIDMVSLGQVCTGDTVLLTARNADSTNKYEWSPKVLFTSNDLALTSAVVDTSVLIKLQVTSAISCIAYDSLYIATYPCCDVYLPTAFTPNNDGHNDVFRVISAGHHKISDFRITNRWGQTVFETVNEARGWDGTFNGVVQDLGTYFYYIKYQCSNGRTYEKRGDVVLVR